MKPTTLPDPAVELGRRLLAALLSYQLGIAFACALNKYVPQDIDPSWRALGHALLHDQATFAQPRPGQC